MRQQIKNFLKYIQIKDFDNKLSGTVFLYHWEQMKWQVNVWDLCYQSIISQTGMKMLLNLFFMNGNWNEINL